ncbi:hypothetical protein VM98_34140, partial [Streptomyces rubellomurinus subsp. indigoferus]
MAGDGRLEFWGGVRGGELAAVERVVPAGGSGGGAVAGGVAGGRRRRGERAAQGSGGYGVEWH